MGITVNEIMLKLKNLEKAEESIKEIVCSMIKISKADVSKHVRMDVYVDGDWRKVVSINPQYILKAYQEQLDVMCENYLSDINQLRGNGIEVDINECFDENSKFIEDAIEHFIYIKRMVVNK